MRTEYKLVNQPTVFGGFQKLIDRNKHHFSEATCYDEHFKSKIIFFHPFFVVFFLFVGFVCVSVVVLHAHTHTEVICGNDARKTDGESLCAVVCLGFSWNMIWFVFCFFFFCLLLWLLLSCVYAYHNAANGLHCSQHAVAGCASSVDVIFRLCFGVHVHFWCFVMDWISNDAKSNELSQKSVALFFEVRRNGILSSVKSDSAAARVFSVQCTYIYVETFYLFNLSDIGSLLKFSELDEIHSMIPWHLIHMMDSMFNSISNVFFFFRSFQLYLDWSFSINFVAHFLLLLLLLLGKLLFLPREQERYDLVYSFIWTFKHFQSAKTMHQTTNRRKWW